ncbi:MAG: hypothetical protein ACJ8AW_54930 [Rhodopila sp.]
MSFPDLLQQTINGLSLGVMYALLALGFTPGQFNALYCQLDGVVGFMKRNCSPPPGSIETMFIKGLGIQAGSEPILPILERSAWGGIRGRMLK